MRVRGGEEQHDLYTGTFAAAKVLHDLYYDTTLKSVRVDRRFATIEAPARGHAPGPGNGCPADKTSTLVQPLRPKAVVHKLDDAHRRAC